MSILSDVDIEKLIHLNQLGIEPFNIENLTPNGYDLTIDEIYIKNTDLKVHTDFAIIPPLSWFVISTKEYIKIGSNFTSQLWIRSSYARKGIFASFGKVDAGFNGTLTISCFNSNNVEIQIPIGDRFCQIVFEKLSSTPSELYEEKSGNYQNQKGIKL
jgi:dCTP deaminase